VFSDAPPVTKGWVLLVFFLLALPLLGVHVGRALIDRAARNRTRGGPEADYEDPPPDP